MIKGKEAAHPTYPDYLNNSSKEGTSIIPLRKVSSRASCIAFSARETWSLLALSSAARRTILIQYTLCPAG